MIESQTNPNPKEPSPISTTSPCIKFKINHPKLHSHIYTISRSLPFSFLIKQLTKNNLLSLFNNYHFQVDSLPLISQQSYSNILNNKPRDIIQLEVVFHHFTHATAMHHFKIVKRLLKYPQRLRCIFIGNCDRKGVELDMEELSVELVPEEYRGYKWDIEEVISPNYKGELHQERTGMVELVQFLEYSGFNPPPEQAKFGGDFFYIHLKTLENADLHLTACPSGFYLNQSKLNSYNPTIHHSKHTFQSLLDLLLSASDKFATAFHRLLHSRPLLSQLAVSTPHPSSSHNRWLDIAENEHHWNSRREGMLRDVEIGGEDFRNWNQEFVELARVREGVKSEGSGWWEQGFRELYGEFLEAAEEVTRLILEGRVKAINYTDQKKRHIFIHNKMFMSATSETPYDHRISKDEEVLPSSSSVSTDILNLERLNSLKPKGLRLLQTLLISYQGCRMLVQTIIPGLLTSELNTITLYGTLDDSSSIQVDESFRQLLLPLCRSMHLDSNITAQLKSQETVIIAVSPQIKGIRSTSGQYFLCDLQKFSPRDLNYIGIEHEGCVIRYKLINQYVEENHIDFDTIPPINTNIATETKFLPGPNHQQQENFLKDIAKYLKQTAIPKLITALKSKNPGDFLTDSSGISAVFHDHGVNMRYLGFVQQHEQLKDNIQVRICLTRVILVRSLKHLIKLVLRSSSTLHTSTALSHILNCLFGKKNILTQLANVEQVVEEKTELNETKRKKKKKKEEDKEIKIHLHQQSRIIKLQPCRYLTMKPQAVWDEVNKISKARFGYQFQQTIISFHQKGLFRMTYQKYATLRDVCLCIGIVLERKDYTLAETDHSSDTPPFSPKNILYFNTVSKTINLTSSTHLLALKTQADRLFSSNSYKEALAAYNNIISEIRQRKEGECIMSYCLGQVSRIEYMLGNLRQSIVIETQNLVFSQKMGRQDCLQVTRCYSRLGLYCMSLGAKDLSLWLLYKGLHLMLMSFGEAYPDILINFANIARVHQQNREAALASNCYLKAIDLLSQVYGGKNHVNTSFCYSSLASLHYELGEYRKSAEYQGEAVAILQKVLSTDDMRYTDAAKIHKMYREFCTNKGGNLRPSDHNSRDRKK